MTGWLAVLPFAAVLALWLILMAITRRPSAVTRPRTQRDALIEFGRAVSRLEEIMRGAVTPAVARVGMGMRDLTRALREAEQAARRAGGAPPPW